MVSFSTQLAIKHAAFMHPKCTCLHDTTGNSTFCLVYIKTAANMISYIKSEKIEEIVKPSIRNNKCAQRKKLDSYVDTQHS